MILFDGIELFHASYMIVKKPDLSACASGKDFGRGFYLTTNYEQACRFVKTSVEKAVKNGIKDIEKNVGYVSVFKYNERAEKNISYYEFSSAGNDWLHCVVAHRKSGLLNGEISKWKKYDILAGKIANDSTNQVITAYMNGFYGKIGSDEAYQTAIRFLLPNKLSDQICFRTKKALASISFQKYKTIKIAGR